LNYAASRFLKRQGNTPDKGRLAKASRFERSRAFTAAIFLALSL
jgi:hypothetical protein